MADRIGSDTTLIDAIAHSADLEEFLRDALVYGIRKSGSTEGSAFLFNGATETLELRDRTRAGGPRPDLKAGEGVAGAVFSARRSRIFFGKDLEQQFIPWGGMGCEGLRAVAGIPIFLENEPQGVLCFDFKNRLNEGQGLFPEEQAAVAALGAEIQSRPFGNALWRVRVNQAQLNIRVSGEGPAQQRQAVAEYLGKFLEGFRRENRPDPDMLYVQLVDRRRGTVRTIQGQGLPLSFQMSLSHPLDSDDVQAHVVRDRRPRLIVGKHPFFDPAVYDRFGHDRFVRLWLPLFPFPTSWIASRPGRKLEEALHDVLKWGEMEQGEEWAAMTADWNTELIPEDPPPTLVYGTLEVGFQRADLKTLGFEPFSAAWANWCAAQAYSPSEAFFRATLPGSLDSIGRSVAEIVWPKPIRLSVAMPDWRTPEERRYPADPSWKAAIPRTVAGVSPLPDRPARVELISAADQTDSAGTALSTDFPKKLFEAAETAVHVALRLDDHAADLYTLIEESEPSQHPPTRFPDPQLDPILQEICREAAAERCTYFLFHLRADSGKDWQLIGTSQSWPTQDGPGDWQNPERELAEKTAERRTPQYRSLGPKKPVVAALPLDLGESTQVVLVLHYSPLTQLAEGQQRELEGRVSRWLYRLSLRHQFVGERFSRMIRSLREKTAEAARNTAGLSKIEFAHDFAKRVLTFSAEAFKPLASILTISSAPQTGPSQVERFWCCPDSAGWVDVIDFEIFVDSWESSPGAKAVKTHTVVIYPPGDPRREPDSSPANAQLLERAGALKSGGKSDKAQRLEKLVDWVKGLSDFSTMIILPLVGHATTCAPIRGSLAVLLPGLHGFSPAQNRLLVELGDLIAKAFEELRARDSEEITKSQAARLEAATADLAKAKSSDEVVGGLLHHLGLADQADARRPGSRLEICEHAVVWLLAPGYRELVARSGRGAALEILGPQTVMDPNAHPFLQREIRSDCVPKRKMPLLDGFRVWTLNLAAESGTNELCRRYLSLPNTGWLLCFPLMYEHRRLIGVVDILRPRPLLPAEELPINTALRRLSLQTCNSFDRCRFERLIDFSRILTDEVNRQLSDFCAPEAYRAIVEKTREEMGVECSDLFLERDGRLVLQASSRWPRPLEDKTRNTYWIQPGGGSDILGTALFEKRNITAHSGHPRPDLDHLSPDLRTLVQDDHNFERIAVPLGGGKDRSSPPVGLLYLRGPLSPCSEESPLRVVKKSGRVTAEHLRHALDLSVAVHRLAMNCQLSERQFWLINELQHSLGQPLQVLRSWFDDTLLNMAQKENPQSMKQLKKEIDRGFELVHEARGRLAAYAKINQVLDSGERRSFSLDRMVRDLCQFMSPEARRKGITIECDISKIPPIIGFEEILRAAISNLLDNAIKYSYDNHYIKVRLFEMSTGQIRLSVENFGVGIPAEDLDRIFEPYYRSRVPDEKGVRRGTGIGLAIVKQAVEKIHQGTVYAVSTPPKTIDPKDYLNTEVQRQPHLTVFLVTLWRNRLEKLAQA